MEVRPRCVSPWQPVSPGSSSTQAPHAGVGGGPAEPALCPTAHGPSATAMPVSPCSPSQPQRHRAQVPRGPGLLPTWQSAEAASRGADCSRRPTGPTPAPALRGWGLGVSSADTTHGPCRWAPPWSPWESVREGAGHLGRGRLTAVPQVPATPALPVPSPATRGVPALGWAGLSRPLAGRPGLTVACPPAPPRLGGQVFLKSDSLCLMEGRRSRAPPTLPSARLLAMHIQQLEIGGFTMTNGAHRWSKLR